MKIPVDGKLLRIFIGEADKWNGKPLYDLKLLTTGGSRQFDTDKVIQRYDHRIAMSLAIGAMQAEGTSAIEDIGWVGKSFGGFQEVLQNLGARIEEKWDG